MFCLSQLAPLSLQIIVFNYYGHGWTRDKTNPGFTSYQICMPHNSIHILTFEDQPTILCGKFCSVTGWESHYNPHCQVLLSSRTACLSLCPSDIVPLSRCPFKRAEGNERGSPFCPTNEKKTSLRASEKGRTLKNYHIIHFSC